MPTTLPPCLSRLSPSERENASWRSCALLTGVRMAVGVSETESVATFCESYEEPPYYVSRGREEAGDTVVFFYEGHWTEFDRRAVISPSEALEAMKEFFATARRPTRVAWTRPSRS